MRTGIVILVLVAVLAGSGYVGWVLIQRSEPVSLPDPTGAFQVGRRTFEWTDTTRKDPYGDGPRKLAVWVWYPVAKGTTGRRVEYAPGLWGAMHLKSPVALFQGPFDSLRDHALDKAAVAPGRFPVVVLMPGMGLSAPMYASLAEDLASHGYLVAGVTPTHSANVTVLDGRTIESSKDANPENIDPHADLLISTWSADARFAGATVAKLFRANVEGAIGTSYIGHSFGGATALEACRTDPRCAAAADLDGRQYGAVVQKGLRAPMLLLGADDSCITGTCGPDARDDGDREPALSLLKASTGTAWCATIPGTRHFNFTDYGAYYLAYPLRKYLPLGSVGPRHALTVQNGYVTTFLAHALYHQAAPGAPACKS